MTLSVDEISAIRQMQHVEVDVIYGRCLRCGDSSAAAEARGYFLPCGALQNDTASDLRCNRLFALGWVAGPGNREADPAALKQRGTT